jgi:signal peptidase I
VFAVLGFAAVVVLPGLLMAYVFKSRLLRSFQAWLPTLASPVVMIVVALLVVQPFLSQMFSAPSNAMAPTLLGDHWRGTCPECGRPSFASPLPPGTYRPSIGRQPMICENFHLSRGTVAPRVLAGDRFLVAKYLKPRRWDLVVFRSPRDPSTLNVKRLVGLPGEKIQIKDDAVWADGKKLTPPDSIRGIRYLSEFPMHPIVRGSADHPVTLAADEYFVLGDFSANSEDSRFWTQGAPGHQPFAVPHSHVCGVVTHICWPPQRWRILR